MTSTRHNPVLEEGFVTPLRGSSTSDTYLNAAREALLDLGWSRTTLTEIARRAGVSRMTLYRAWPDMNSLLGDLMTREWADVLTVSKAADHRERVVESVVGSVKALRGNEMFNRIIELDPERLLPYLLQRQGRSQELLVSFLAEGIRVGQAEGQIREGDADLIADTILLQAHGFALSAQTFADTDERIAQVDFQFTDALMRYLAP
ncbi:MAG TPA: TetR/AcrR family transcriptional regulator [Marmoricola sp.]|nr:TetR/AcrR family transcriptional regulator [Marmoricola sp.]